jgi:ATP-dependent DNA helicase Q4
MAIALDQKRGISHDGSNKIEFPVVEIASAIGWDSGTVKQHLKNLEWSKGECFKVLFVGI